MRASDEAQMLQDTCHAIVDLGGYVMAWIGFAQHDERKTLHSMARAGLGMSVLAPVDGTWAEEGWGAGPTGTAIRTANVVVVRDIGRAIDLHPDALHAEACAHGYGAVCALPLRAGDKVLGALTILDAEAGAFGAAELETLGGLARDLALGVSILRDRTDQHRAAQRLLLVDRALRTLSAGNRVLLRCTDEAELLAEMCRAVVELGGYRLAWVGYAQNDPEKTIVPMAHAGFNDGMFEKLRMTWADTPDGQIPPAIAIRTRKPCVRLDFATDPRFAAFRQGAHRRGLNASSTFPLIVDGEVIGTLDIVASEVDAFGDDELAVLNELSADLSFGISNLRMRLRQRDAERTIERMAFTDALTGLPNRTRLRDQLGSEIDQVRQQQRSLALLVLNVDRFRDINEVLGYQQGDGLIVELAQRLAKQIGPSAILARMGVDEFAILLPGAGAEHAEATARVLLRGFNEAFEVAGTRVEIQASIGIALFPGHGAEPDALIQRADAAMYEAKRERKGIAVFRGDSEAQARERLSLMAELRRAIEDDQLCLYCQPKVDMATGQVCGAEALVRWLHPQRGLILPDRFIPLAERTGLINSLTNWVLHAALGQCYSWRSAGIELPLAVNLSARNLMDPGLLNRLTGLLTTWGAEPAWLQFELTESALMEDAAKALEILTQLSAMGFRLYVDDYGTGYSSLSYLQKLPIDALKIDKSFVLGMPTDRDSANIVRSTVEMAHNIGLEVVAEGTENRLIWDELASFHADVAQGTYISNPMPTAQFQDWSAHHSMESRVIH
nr:EAL domain-containing protein [Aromatoleum diolicum]